MSENLQDPQTYQRIIVDMHTSGTHQSVREKLWRPGDTDVGVIMPSIPRSTACSLQSSTDKLLEVLSEWLLNHGLL